MSTSLLYHGRGARGYQYVATSYQGGTVCFSIDQDPDTFRYPRRSGEVMVTLELGGAL